MTDNNDLHGLIDSANKSMHGEKPVVARTRRAFDFSIIGKVLVLALIPIAIFSVIDRFAVDGLSDIAVETQLVNMLHTAQNSLRESTRDGQSLPAILPNAALANIVTYRVMGDDYILIAESNGIKVSLNSHGRQSVFYPD